MGEKRVLDGSDNRRMIAMLEGAKIEEMKRKGRYLSISR